MESDDVKDECRTPGESHQTSAILLGKIAKGFALWAARGIKGAVVSDV